MGYVYRCPRCSRAIEEDDRENFRNALSKHFKNNHPDMNTSDYNVPDFG